MGPRLFLLVVHNILEALIYIHTLAPCFTQKPPESMALVGQCSPQPIYFPGFDPMLFTKIVKHVDFYFSADNLSKDKYLRQHMDDEGWAPVSLIAGFRKLAELTNNVQIILDAVRSSAVVEVQKWVKKACMASGSDCNHHSSASGSCD